MVAILTSLIIILDQASKFIVSKYSDLLPIEIIKGIFSIDLVYNKGAAFGILQNQALFFILVSLIAILFIILIIGKGAGGMKIPLSLMLGGAVGNLIDRLRFGYVIDFLDFKIWPVFNIADSAITIGAILLLLQILLSKAKSRR